MGIPSSLFPLASPRSRAGVSARQAGKSFEDLIEASQRDAQGPVCSLIRLGQVARWIPSEPEWRRKTGDQMKLIAQRGPFDFAGCVWERGIGIFFDAKSLGEKSASFPVNDPKVVKPHQIRALETLEAAGAFAGFLVKCGRMNDVRWIWAEAAAKWARAGKPIQWGEGCWQVLGTVEWGRAIPLRKLFEAYK